ncbi:hypothetical protein A4A49_51027, partial [Nicotiana attenuata]
NYGRQPSDLTVMRTQCSWFTVIIYSSLFLFFAFSWDSIVLAAAMDVLTISPPLAISGSTIFASSRAILQFPT